MSRVVILYGLCLAALVALLKFLEFRYFVHDLSVEFYLAILAIVFVTIGIWAGRRLTSKKIITVTIEPPSDFQLDQKRLDRLGISKREHEVLGFMAQGLSNQEIAEKMFVSVNTIKTHSANLFSKLDVKRRTQAVQKGKELLLIP